MPRRLAHAIAIALATLIASAPQHQAAAQTDVDPQAIQAQIADLEQQLTTLRSALATPPKPAPPAAPDPTALLKPAGAKSKPDAATPRGPRRISSVIELLDRLPKDIQADKNGLWLPSLEPDAIDHLTYGVWNTPYVAKLEVQDVRIDNNPALTTDPLASPFKISITFAPITHDFHDQKLREAFSPVVIFADARLRQRIDRLKPGRKTDVRATLKTITPGSIGSKRLRPSPFGDIRLTNHFKTIAIPGILPEQ